MCAAIPGPRLLPWYVISIPPVVCNLFDVLCVKLDDFDSASKANMAASGSGAPVESEGVSNIQLTSCAFLFSIHVSLLFSFHGMPLFYLRLCYI